MAWRPVGANPFPKPKLTTCHLGHGEEPTVTNMSKINHLYWIICIWKVCLYFGWKTRHPHIHRRLTSDNDASWNWSTSAGYLARRRTGSPPFVRIPTPCWRVWRRPGTGVQCQKVMIWVHVLREMRKVALSFVYKDETLEIKTCELHKVKGIGFWMRHLRMADQQWSEGCRTPLYRRAPGCTAVSWSGRWGPGRKPWTE